MAVRTLASRAFPKMAVDQRDLLARDQFIDGLTEDSFRLRVRRSKPTSLDDAIRAALEFEAIDTAEQRRQGTTSSSVATIAPPQPATSELTNMMQELVTALRHVSPQGGNPRGHGRGRGRYVECWNCGEPGHVRARCPRLAARNEANGIVTMSVGANWPIDVEKSHVVHAEAKIAGQNSGTSFDVSG